MLPSSAQEREYLKYLLFLKNKVTVFWRKLPTHRMPECCGLLVMAKEKEKEMMKEKSYE